MNNEVSTLRQDIDSIHTDGIGKGSGAVKNVAYIGNCTMWRCGRRILEEYPELADGNLSVGGRGVERLSFNSLSKMLVEGKVRLGGRGVTAVSFRSIARDLGRESMK